MIEKFMEAERISAKSEVLLSYAPLIKNKRTTKRIPWLAWHIWQFTKVKVRPEYYVLTFRR